MRLPTRPGATAPPAASLASQDLIARASFGLLERYMDVLLPGDDAFVCLYAVVLQAEILLYPSLNDVASGEAPIVRFPLRCTSRVTSRNKAFQDAVTTVTTPMSAASGEGKVDEKLKLRCPMGEAETATAWRDAIEGCIRELRRARLSPSLGPSMHRMVRHHSRPTNFFHADVKLPSGKIVSMALDAEELLREVQWRMAVILRREGEGDKPVAYMVKLEDLARPGIELEPSFTLGENGIYGQVPTVLQCRVDRTAAHLLPEYAPKGAMEFNFGRIWFPIELDPGAELRAEYHDEYHCPCGCCFFGSADEMRVAPDPDCSDVMIETCAKCVQVPLLLVGCLVTICCLPLVLLDPDCPSPRKCCMPGSEHRVSRFFARNFPGSLTRGPAADRHRFGQPP